MKTDRHCEKLLATISEYVDGSLNQELCTELEKHLNECQDCTVVVNTLRKTIDLYHKAAIADDELPQEVRERLYLRLHLEDYS